MKDNKPFYLQANEEIVARLRRRLSFTNYETDTNMSESYIHRQYNYLNVLMKEHYHNKMYFNFIQMLSSKNNLRFLNDVRHNTDIIIEFENKDNIVNYEIIHHVDMIIIRVIYSEFNFYWKFPSKNDYKLFRIKYGTDMDYVISLFFS